MTKKKPLRGMLSFEGAGVRALVEHAVSCDRFRLTFEERARIYGDDNMFERQTGEQSRITAALTLVKDQGVYLMSNGIPELADVGADVPGRKLTERESRSNMKANDGFRSKVVYAQGYAPKNDDFSWYDRARATLGGDDFATRIEIEAVEAGLRAQGGKTLKIGVYDEHFDIGAR